MSISALQYLTAPAQHTVTRVCAVVGDDSFLRSRTLLLLRQAVGGGDTDATNLSLSTYNGNTALWKDLEAELSTVSMFSDERVVLLEDADKFIEKNRPQLEDYVEKPTDTAFFLIDVQKMPKNTRLYKAIDKNGLLIDATAPKDHEVAGWVVRWAQAEHKVKIKTSAAALMVEMTGPVLGLLDQQLAKMALMVKKGEAITDELVAQSSGSWRAKTTWDMIDLALAGNLVASMLQLERLFAAGEEPIVLLAQISTTLRRLAAATRIFVSAEKSGHRTSLSNALIDAGTPKFFLQKTEQQIKHLGRERGKQLYGWLLQADKDLKGESLLEARLILEMLIIRVAMPRT